MSTLPHGQQQLCFGMAPNVPSMNSFALEATTLRILQEPAATLANALLYFIQDYLVAAILKVRHVKCAIKINVFNGGVMCTIKVRLYRTSAGEHAVEFQRRCGDRMVFLTTFKAASVFFINRFGDSVLPPPLPCVALVPYANVVQPILDKTHIHDLLDLVHFASDPLHQVDVALVLADADDASLAKLCEDVNAMQAIRTLLDADRLEVAYPAALLLSKLAALPDAVMCFEKTGLLLAMCERAHATQVKLLRHKLKETIMKLKTND